MDNRMSVNALIAMIIGAIAMTTDPYRSAAEAHDRSQHLSAPATKTPPSVARHQRRHGRSTSCQPPDWYYDGLFDKCVECRRVCEPPNLTYCRINCPAYFQRHFVGVTTTSLPSISTEPPTREYLSSTNITASQHVTSSPTTISNIATVWSPPATVTIGIAAALFVVVIVMAVVMALQHIRSQRGMKAWRKCSEDRTSLTSSSGSSNQSTADNKCDGTESRYIEMTATKMKSAKTTENAVIYAVIAEETCTPAERQKPGM